MISVIPSKSSFLTFRFSVQLTKLDFTSSFVFFTLQSTSSSLSRVSCPFARDSGDCDSFHGADTLFVEAQLCRAVSSNVICFVDESIRTTSARLIICFSRDLKTSRFPSNFDSLADPKVYLLVILSLHPRYSYGIRTSFIRLSNCIVASFAYKFCDDFIILCAFTFYNFSVIRYRRRTVLILAIFITNIITYMFFFFAVIIVIVVAVRFF